MAKAKQAKAERKRVEAELRAKRQAEEAFSRFDAQRESKIAAAREARERLAPPVLKVSALVEQSYQALDRHLTHWASLDSDAHIEQMVAFARTYGRVEVAPYMLATERTIWTNGVTTLLDPEIGQLVEEGASVLPDAELLPEIVPYPTGIVMAPNGGELFRYRHPADAAEGVPEMAVVALGWTVTEGIMVKGQDGELHPQRGVAISLYGSYEWLQAWLGRERKTVSPSGFYLMDHSPWAFNNSWVSRDEPENVTNEIVLDEYGRSLCDPEVGRTRRWVLALWSFMADEIIRAPRQTLPRHVARRAARTPVVTDLRILHLRKVVRPESEYGGSADREYTHRWMVKGHWRKLASGRLTWVRGHIRGPGDKPFILKNDIVAVRR